MPVVARGAATEPCATRSRRISDPSLTCHCDCTAPPRRCPWPTATYQSNLMQTAHSHLLLDNCRAVKCAPSHSHGSELPLIARPLQRTTQSSLHRLRAHWAALPRQQTSADAQGLVLLAIAERVLIRRAASQKAFSMAAARLRSGIRVAVFKPACLSRGLGVARALASSLAPGCPPQLR